MPDYRADNPYQTLLAGALQQEQVNVHFPAGYRRIFPIFRAMQDCHDPVQVLHLHWINPYLKGTNWLLRLLYSLKFLLDIFLVRMTGVRVVWTIHNRLAHEAQFPGLELWTVRWLVKLVDRIIVHHQAARSELAELYQFNLEKATVIPHGHYRSLYGNAIDSSEARAILGLPAAGKVYLNLGMLRPYKGIEQLLQTWKQHPEITADHTLLIAGKPKDETYGQQLVEQATAVKGIVLHQGFIDDHLIPVYLSAADVVILPFKDILTSGSLILAMSFDRPIIAPRMPGIAETLGTASDLLYAPQDEQGLLNAIQKSVNSDLTALRHFVERECDRFNWKFIAGETAQAYEYRKSKCK